MRGCSNTVGSGTVGFSFSMKPYRFLRWSKNHLLQACFWGWTTKAQAHIRLGPHRTRTTDRTRPRRPGSQDRPGPEGQAHTGAGPKRNSQPPPAGPNRIRATLQNAKHSSKNSSRKAPPQESRKISEIAPKKVSRRTPNRTPTVFEQPRKLETFEKKRNLAEPQKKASRSLEIFTNTYPDEIPGEGPRRRPAHLLVGRRSHCHQQHVSAKMAGARFTDRHWLAANTN